MLFFKRGLGARLEGGIVVRVEETSGGNRWGKQVGETGGGNRWGEQVEEISPQDTCTHQNTPHQNTPHRQHRVLTQGIALDRCSTACCWMPLLGHVHAAAQNTDSSCATGCVSTCQCLETFPHTCLCMWGLGDGVGKGEGMGSGG